MPTFLLRCFLLFGLCASEAGCAAWYDLFSRDQPRPDLLAAARAQPSPAQTDVAVVLGCPANPDGSPSICLQCRVKAARLMLTRGRVRAAIFAGGAAHNQYVEADVMAEMAQSLGIPPAQILRERHSLTTWQNLRFTQRIMKKSGFQTALLISTRDHLPRARRFADYYGLSVALLSCEEALAEIGDFGPTPADALR